MIKGDMFFLFLSSVSHASLPGRSEEAMSEMKLVDIPNTELLIPTIHQNTTQDQVLNTVKPLYKAKFKSTDKLAL